MKYDVIIAYILVETPLAIFYYSKQEVNEFCRVAGVLRSTVVTLF